MPSKLRMSALLLTAGLCFTARSAVQVTIDNKLYQYDNKPRLAEVLAPVALERNWYWPAAALYQLDSPEPEQLRAELLALIGELLAQYQGDAAAQQSLQAIKTQLTSWRLAKRLAISIDYDAARIKPALNPRFGNGAYLLQLSTRPNHIYLFGAVETEVVLEHRPATPVVDYIVAANTTALAEQSKAMIILPANKMATAGVAYWNQTYSEVMPGAQLFIPLKTSMLDTRFAKLNQGLSELAMHRVLP